MAKRYATYNAMKRPATNIQRSGVNRTSNNNIDFKLIVTITAIFSLLTIGLIFSSFGSINAVYAQQRQQKNSNDNNNNNNNASNLSLSTFSTAIGTGAAATGIIVAIPGVLRTRSQSKYLSIYLLKVHDTYHEILYQVTKGQANKRQEYQDTLDSIRREAIYLLQKRRINENQFKMLDDRIVEYLNKINGLR